MRSAAGESRRDEVLRLLAESSASPLMTAFPHGALFAFGQDLRVLCAGGGLIGVMGMDPDEVVGQRPSDFLPREAAELAETSWRAVLAGATSRRDVPYEGRVFQHELAPVEADGQVVAGLGFLQEVTEARRAEHALAESELRLRLLLDRAPIGMALVETDGRFREANPALCALLGWSEVQLIGMSVYDLTHPDDSETTRGLHQRTLAGELPGFELEKRYVTASGSVLWAMTTVVLVRDAKGEPLYFVAQIQDFTERKRQHDALRDLTSMMAHEVRGPAGVVSGLLDVLLATWDQRSEEQRLEIVQRAATTMGVVRNVLENTLTVSTMDAQELTARADDVRVGDAVETVLQTVPHPGLSVTVAGATDARCRVDPAHLVQALSNLVTNAAKYAGGALCLTVDAHGGWTTIEVTDDGPGVPEEFEPLLFERFSRSTDARSSGQAGSGLGLYIVRDLMRLNGGEVTYAAAPGGGAVFTLRLPTS
jgi:PAS domain S-box-containing protein